MKQITCFSVGYQGRTVDDLVKGLVARRVSLVIDVRENAWSQRPDCRKGALSSALEGRGIKYLHLKRAGNPFRPRSGEKRDLDECAKLYRAYLSRNPEIVVEVARVVRSRRAALLCYEAIHEQCHRSVLSTALKRVVAGLNVEHIAVGESRS